MPTAAANTRNLENYLDAVHREPAIQAGAPSARKRATACIIAMWTETRCWTARRACGASMPAMAGREITDAVARQLEKLDYAPSFQMGHPIAFEFAEKLAEIAPGGPAAEARPRLLRRLRLGSGGHRAQDRGRLSARYRPGHPHALDRARARLSWRGLRRHFGGRAGQQPPRLSAAARRRSSQPHP